MALRSTEILTQTPQGLYCPLGDFHIDPVRPVDRALITHGHSDHARSGHRSVLATRETLLIMALHRPMEIDRPVVPSLPDQCHDALGLAQRIGADDMGCLLYTSDAADEL